MGGPGACPGWGGTCVPGSCRDKGRGGVEEGAWCLSWLGGDLVAPRSPHWITLPPGQAPGPHAVVNIHQDRGRHITGFGRQNPLPAFAGCSALPIYKLKPIYLPRAWAGIIKIKKVQLPPQCASSRRKRT